MVIKKTSTLILVNFYAYKYAKMWNVGSVAPENPDPPSLKIVEMASTPLKILKIVLNQPKIKT